MYFGGNAKAMTKKQKEVIQEVKAELQKYVGDSDFEVAHEKADAAIIKLLEGIGLQDVSDLYKKIGKWYS